jgi:signal transduction histidine kinase
MKPTESDALRNRYLQALRLHLAHSQSTDGQVTREIGCQAVALKMETLDLAKLHNTALASLLLPVTSTATQRQMTQQAAIFFAEVLLPIEQTHRGARATNDSITVVVEALGERTLALADSHREMRQSVQDRKAAENELRVCDANSRQLLADSRILEQHLQRVTHETIASCEAERTKLSRQLQDEIAQPLLGIQVRLLALKKEVAANLASLTRDITDTQRMVEASLNTIKRFTLEFDASHES